MLNPLPLIDSLYNAQEDKLTTKGRKMDNKVTGLSARFDPRLKARATDELIGICRGILADGEVNDTESKFLYGWLRENMQYCNEFPFKNLLETLERVLLDDSVDEDEQLELIDLFLMIIGEPKPVSNDSGEIIALTAGSASPFTTEILPSIEGVGFTLTGAFEAGTRKEVFDKITNKGGLQVKNLSRKKTNFLVIGKLMSDRWKHSSFGNKILGAIEWNMQGVPIHIISEETLFKDL